MARRQSALVNWSQYVAARGLTALLQCFPVEENLRTMAAFGSWYYRRSRRRRERATENVARSFPEWSAERVDRVAERSFQHMFELFGVEAMLTPRLITPDTWPDHVEVGEVAAVIDRMVRGEPAILITGHYGNWELLASLMAVLGYPLHALARPIDNPLINDWVMGIREARGTKILTKFGSMPIVQQVIRKGGRVAFVADQNAGDQGIFVPFFGRLASTYKSIALLAMRYETAIVVGGARRVGAGFRYRFGVSDIIDPGDWADHPNPVFYISARFNRAMELMVREAPEQYLWVHRRWKSRPRHERLGKPMPKRMIENLRSLPWMTEEELARIVESSNPAAGRAAPSREASPAAAPEREPDGAIVP